MWVIKHVVSPLDRIVVTMSRGRLPPPSRIAVPTLLLTTVGRQSGRERTIPLVYVRDGQRYVVANARPAGERSNPWIANLRASGQGHIRVRGRTILIRARELDEPDVDQWWTDLTDRWPAFADHYAATGERTVFILEPRTERPDDSTLE